VGQTLAGRSHGIHGSPGLIIETWETRSFDRPGTSTEAQAFCILMEAAGSKLTPAS
jgi:hypothetical protein